MEQTVLQLLDDEYEALWIESALKAKAEAEAEWRRRGQTFAFVHPEPTYVSASEWSFYADIPDPEVPCERILRFDLIDGGHGLDWTRRATLDEFDRYPLGATRRGRRLDSIPARDRQRPPSRGR
jgi:hypothetical protein